MAYYGVFVQKLLIVELLRKHFFLCRRADKRALIGKHELLCPYKLARAGEENATGEQVPEMMIRP